MTRIPLSLYIHLPWCVRKCPYCDFNSHALRDALPEDAYVAALMADLAEEMPHAQGRRLHSIFFGGGTPSLFSAAGIAKILKGVHQQFAFDDSCEITLEANPGTVEQTRFMGYRQAGVNRISLGIQSFNEEHLKALGRIHGSDEAHRGIDAVQAAGFDNFNLDLMHGLSAQTIEQALQDLNTALTYAPTHLSWYQLTLEPNTLFFKKPPTLPDEDLIAVMQEQGRALLATHGYSQYEVSAYSQAQKQCQHNLNYWQFGDYLGIGAGAHGKVTNLTTGQITRRTKTRHPKDYLNPDSAFLASSNVISTQALAFEFMLNALRLQQPLSWALFTERTGLSPHMLQPVLSSLQKKGLVHNNEESLILTAHGRLFLDDVVSNFL